MSWVGDRDSYGSGRSADDGVDHAAECPRARSTHSIRAGPIMSTSWQRQSLAESLLCHVVPKAGHHSSFTSPVPHDQLRAPAAYRDTKRRVDENGAGQRAKSWKDRAVLVRPYPGANKTNVLNALQEIQSKAANTRTRPPNGLMNTRHHQYLTWANEAAQRLRNQISDADIERLIFTRRYWLVLSSPPEPHLVDMINMELDERATALKEARDALEAQYVRWSGDAVFVVPDTSVFIEHPDKLEDIDLAAELGVDAQSLLLLVPIIVIDELDGLKRSKDRYLRWRAAYSLAYLDRLLPDPTHITQMRAAGPSPKDAGVQRGETYVELIFDPPGHERLPIADDEIVDRALAIRDLAGREVTVVTYDSGQATRARRAGLRVCRLTHPLERDEPARDNGKTRR